MTSYDMYYVKCNIYIILLVATVITKPPQDKTLAWPNKVQFECQATSDDSTPVTIYWEKDDRPIQYQPGRIGKQPLIYNEYN